MKRVAFTMKLHPGKKAEYKKRHDALWPELSALLKESGISDYSIFLDEENSILFGVYKLSENHKADQLPNHAVMKKWWSYMKDLMETHPDHSPVSKPLLEMFYME